MPRQANAHHYSMSKAHIPKATTLHRRKHLIIWLALIISPRGSASNSIAVNVHSDSLSRALHANDEKTTDNKAEAEKEHKGESSNSDSDTEEKTASQILSSLDLAGNLNFHLLSPRNWEENSVSSSTRPLLDSLGQRAGPMVPSVRVGVRYNFSERWYGVTRIFSTLAWKLNKETPQSQSPGQPSSHTDQTGITKYGKLKKWHRSPLRVLCHVEKGLVSNHQSAFLTIKKQSLFDPKNTKFAADNDPCVTANIVKSSNRGTTATLSVQARLFDRLNVVSKSIFLLPSSSDGSSDDDTIPSSLWEARIPSRDKSDGWIPQLQLTPTGRLTCASEMGWSHKRRTRRLDRHGGRNHGTFPPAATGSVPMGFRLTIRKNLGSWSSIFSPGMMSNDDDTVVSLELMGMDDSVSEASSLRGGEGDKCVYSLLANGSLERIRETAHFTILREQFVG